MTWRWRQRRTAPCRRVIEVARPIEPGWSRGDLDKVSSMGILDRLFGGTAPEADVDSSATSHRQWTNHAGGHYVCTHTGCSKKADPLMADHDCCGRCSSGRKCYAEALNG